MIELGEGDRVLVTRLDYLGDVILSLPLVDAIRERHPGIELDYLTREPAASLLHGDPRFARVIRAERNSGIAHSLGLVRALRKRRYRATIDLYSNPRSAWLSFLSGAPVRIGGDRRGRRHLYTHPTNVPRTVRPASEHHTHFGAPLDVAGPSRKPRIDVTPNERESATRLLGVAETGAPLVTLHPGGKWAVKRWPTESFAKLARRCVEDLGARVTVLTGPDEAVHTDALRAALGDTAAYLDPLPIRTVAAVLAQSDVVVACDGGVMHLSVAVGAPTVGVFGSSEPDVWFPYESHGPYRAAVVDLPCRPCHRHECPLGHTDCLNALTPDAVFELVREVYALPQEKQ